MNRRLPRTLLILAAIVIVYLIGQAASLLAQTVPTAAPTATLRPTNPSASANLA